MEDTAELQIEEAPKHHKLTKEELAAFAPKCCVCGADIPEDRQVRRKRTCSDEHTKHMNQFRRFQQSKIRCSSCGRPSSPEEREDYKRWRAERGEVLKSIGRGAPRKTREKQLESGIRALIDYLKPMERQDLSMGLLDSTIAELEKIIAPIKEP